MTLANNTRVTSFPFTLPVINSNTPMIEDAQVLIPEGPYLTGQDAETEQIVAAFYMDRYEVTTQQYKDFLNDLSLIESLSYDVEKKRVKKGENTLILIDSTANGLKNTDSGFSVLNAFALRPVTGVTWYGARAYAQYHSKRLPTSREWEKASRGMAANLYPWGNEAPNAELCNWLENTTATNVGSYSPQGDSPYGVADMAGNVIEWCSDAFSGDDEKILHGGYWNSSEDEGGVLSSYQWHMPPDSVFIGSGFRCAQDFKN
jgi:formylglycine-generating enzyme required for sulfatase activity